MNTTDTKPTAPGNGVGSGDLLCLLGKTSGWRTRQQIGNLLLEMEECAGAARCCEERKDWPEMLRHLRDGIAAAEKLKEIIQ